MYTLPHASVVEWSITTDCKSVALRASLVRIQPGALLRQGYVVQAQQIEVGTIYTTVLVKNKGEVALRSFTQRRAFRII